MTDKIGTDRFYYESLLAMGKKLREKTQEKWWDAEENPFPWLPSYTKTQQKQYEKSILNHVKAIFSILSLVHRDPLDREIRAQELGYLMRGILDEFSFVVGDLSGFLNKASIHATRAFIERAKRFDSAISPEEIMQALRNLWIVNGIQLTAQKQAAVSHATFAYSMLYPYTDNFLDDDALSMEEKCLKMERFEKRLEGENFSPNDQEEEKLWRLVESIEFEYKREIYKNLYESLLSIHRAQMKSLTQQEATFAFSKDLLGISFEKGGASVVADAYLSLGELSLEEIFYYYQYGVVLQLADDLQDVSEDLEKGHQSILSVQVPHGKLDLSFWKMFHFAQGVMDNKAVFHTEAAQGVGRVLWLNVQNLMLWAALKQEAFFSKEVAGRIEEALPFTNKIGPKIRKVLEKNKAEALLQDEDVQAFIFEALDFAFGEA